MEKILSKSVKLSATIEVTYIPKAAYEVAVRFGRKKIYFDPSRGRTHSISECVCALVNRDDIQDVEQVIIDFVEVATNILKRFYCDGFERH